MNICIKCVYWSVCLEKRYNNIIPDGVTDFQRCKLKDGKEVLYIKECNNHRKYDGLCGEHGLYGIWKNTKNRDKKPNDVLDKSAKEYQ